MNLVKIINEAFSIGMLQHYEEIAMLAGFLIAKKPKNVMEIGTYKGGLFKILCSLSTHKKITVDLNAYYEVHMENRNKMIQGWGENIYTLIGDSQSTEIQQSVRSALNGELLDVIFLDGDHRYEGVKADFENYEPLVTPGGLVIFHDINETQQHKTDECLVSKFWNELTGEKVEMSVNREWGGIGIWQKPNH
jgi:predicted O-methyltransferase YrrM